MVTVEFWVGVLVGVGAAVLGKAVRDLVWPAPTHLRLGPERRRMLIREEER